MTENAYLKPLRRRFQEERIRLNISWEIIEQDYILSWILAAIFSIPKLKDSFVFKGGTALKKCYFGDYRFSQDLDFSVQDNVPKGDALLALMQEATNLAQNLIKQYKSNIEIKCEAYKEKQPHPFGQEAFTISARYPWQRNWNTRVMVEVTMEEPILLHTVTKSILHGYSETMDQMIAVYALEEIIAEKIRAILQYAKKLHERGWGRSRARDYYDLWRILSLSNGYKYESLNLKILPDLIERKCAVKNIIFTSIDNLFTDELMLDLAKSWSEWLGPLVPDLPNLDLVLEELKKSLDAIYNLE